MSNAVSGTTGSSERSLREDLDTLKADLAALKGDLRTFAADATMAGRNGARFARDRMGEAASAAAERGRAAYSVAKEKGQEASDAAEETIQEHPFAAVGIAFGVGLLLGALVSRR